MYSFLYILLPKVRPGTIVAIFSDNDYFVDIKNADVFKQRLGARIIIEQGKGHYAESDNILEIPSIIEELSRTSR